MWIFAQIPIYEIRNSIYGNTLCDSIVSRCGNVGHHLHLRRNVCGEYILRGDDYFGAFLVLRNQFNPLAIAH